jgi:hypothetical protein
VCFPRRFPTIDGICGYYTIRDRKPSTTTNATPVNPEGRKLGLEAMPSGLLL